MPWGGADVAGNAETTVTPCPARGCTFGAPAGDTKVAAVEAVWAHLLDEHPAVVEQLRAAADAGRGRSEARRRGGRPRQATA